MKLPLKLAILVIVIFGLLFTGMALWRPMKVRYYAAKLHSKDIKVRKHAARTLLDMNAKEPVFDYYTERYSSKNVKERMDVVNELCAVNKELMFEIFRNRCRKEQVKMHEGGSYIIKNDKFEKVKIDEFYIDKYEVTNEKYWVFLKFNHFAFEPGNWFRSDDNRSVVSYQLKEYPFTDVADYPVTKISWYDIQAYAKWLGMRLPDDNEWIHAFGVYSMPLQLPFGENGSLLEEYAWFKGNSNGKPHSVAKKKSNKYSLYDMYGNVAELCKEVSHNFTNENKKLIIGGSYNTEIKWLNYFLRSKGDSDTFIIYQDYTYDMRGSEEVGFRCVRDVK